MVGKKRSESAFWALCRKEAKERNWATRSNGGYVTRVRLSQRDGRELLAMLDHLAAKNGGQSDSFALSSVAKCRMGV
jgi:endo-beta-N-acetylglucosaminidase D